MDDFISRKATIDAVETIGFDFSDSDLSAVELEEVCEAIGEVRQEWLQRIKRLPSAQPEPHWIPCSERLPELDVNINVYTKKNPIMVSEPVCISYKLNGRDYVCPIPCILHSNGHWYIDNNSLEDWVNLDDYDSGTEDPLRLQVTAWMPEPEPYAERRSDGCKHNSESYKNTDRCD